MNRAEFPPVRITTAGDQVAGALRDLIAARGWVEGKRLPAEGDMAAQLRVSRGTLRNALRVLCDEGLVTVRSGAQAGTYVGARPASATAPTLAKVIRARRWIEVPAAGNAVGRVDPEQLDDIERRRGTATTGDARFHAHRDFHDVLLAAGGDPLWRELARPLFEWLGAHVDREGVHELTWAAVDRDHRRIVEAVRAGDVPMACEAMASHLDRLGSCYVAMATDRLGTIG